MEKINNSDIVAATLAAAVTNKLDYKENSSNSNLIEQNAINIFKSVYKQIDAFNKEIK